MLNRTLGLVRFLLLAAAFWYLAAYLAVAFFRMAYPFDLGTLDGFSVDIVLRILSGQKIYVSPSLEYAPPIYSFLYYYISALVSKMTGAGFLPLRLVSFVSSMGSFAVVYFFVKRETGNRFAAFIAVCFFAAAFEICGTFDAARVDSLYVLLLFMSLYFIRFSQTAKGAVLAGFLLALSFFAKQSALVFFFPMLLYGFLKDRRLGFYFAGAFLAITVVTSLLLNVIHQGWYGYFLFTLPAQHARAFGDLSGALIYEIVQPMPVALLVALSCLILPKGGMPRDRFLFYPLAALGMAISLSLIVHVGSSVNSLYPFCGMLSIFFGVGIANLHKWIQSVPGVGKQKLLWAAICLLCLFQFIRLWFNPLVYAPSGRTIEEGWRFISMMKNVEGDVYAPFHGYLPLLAGKKSFAHQSGVWDILRGQDGPIQEGLLKEIREAFRQKKFGAIFLWEDADPARKRQLEPYSYYWWEKTGMDEFYVRLGPVYRQKIWGIESLYVPKNNSSHSAG
ncbi:MAG: ArnT family glycosyltransferase [Candidatus Omnitrophota bacterium]